MENILIKQEALESIPVLQADGEYFCDHHTIYKFDNYRHNKIAVFTDKILEIKCLYNDIFVLTLNDKNIEMNIVDKNSFEKHFIGSLDISSYIKKHIQNDSVNSGNSTICDLGNEKKLEKNNACSKTEKSTNFCDFSYTEYQNLFVSKKSLITVSEKEDLIFINLPDRLLVFDDDFKFKKQFDGDYGIVKSHRCFLLYESDKINFYDENLIYQRNIKLFHNKSKMNKNLVNNSDALKLDIHQESTAETNGDSKEERFSFNICEINNDILCGTFRKKYNVFCLFDGDKFFFVDYDGYLHGDVVYYYKYHCSMKKSENQLKSSEKNLSDYEKEEHILYEEGLNKLVFTENRYIKTQRPLSTSENSCNSKISHKTSESKYFIRFSNDCQQLLIIEQQQNMFIFDMFYIKSYKWYHKTHKHIKGRFVQFDQDILYFFTNNMLTKMHFEKYYVNKSNISATNDGHKLYVTDFKKNIISMPMYQYKIELPNFIHCFDISNQFVFLKSDSKLWLVNSDNNNFLTISCSDLLKFAKLQIIDTLSYAIHLIQMEFESLKNKIIQKLIEEENLEVKYKTTLQQIMTFLLNSTIENFNTKELQYEIPYQENKKYSYEHEYDQETKNTILQQDILSRFVYFCNIKINRHFKQFDDKNVVTFSSIQLSQIYPNPWENFLQFLDSSEYTNEKSMKPVNSYMNEDSCLVKDNLEKDKSSEYISTRNLCEKSNGSLPENKVQSKVNDFIFTNINESGFHHISDLLEINIMKDLAATYKRLKLFNFETKTYILDVCISRDHLYILLSNGSVYSLTNMSLINIYDNPICFVKSENWLFIRTNRGVFEINDSSNFIEAACHEKVKIYSKGWGSFVLKDEVLYVTEYTTNGPIAYPEKINEMKNLSNIFDSSQNTKIIDISSEKNPQIENSSENLVFNMLNDNIQSIQKLKFTVDHTKSNIAMTNSGKVVKSDLSRNIDCIEQPSTKIVTNEIPNNQDSSFSHDKNCLDNINRNIDCIEQPSAKIVTNEISNNQESSFPLDKNTLNDIDLQQKTTRNTEDMLIMSFEEFISDSIFYQYCVIKEKLNNRSMQIFKNVTDLHFQDNYLILNINGKLLVFDIYSKLHQSIINNERESFVYGLWNTKLILDVYRGNLELIEPKLIILNKTKQLLNTHNYKDVIDICNIHRISFCIFTYNKIYLLELFKSFCDVHKKQLIMFCVQIYDFLDKLHLVENSKKLESIMENKEVLIHDENYSKFYKNLYCFLKSFNSVLITENTIETDLGYTIFSFKKENAPMLNINTSSPKNEVDSNYFTKNKETISEKAFKAFGSFAGKNKILSRINKSIQNIRQIGDLEKQNSKIIKYKSALDYVIQNYNYQTDLYSKFTKDEFVVEIPRYSLNKNENNPLTQYFEALNNHNTYSNGKIFFKSGEDFLTNFIYTLPDTFENEKVHILCILKKLRLAIDIYKKNQAHRLLDVIRSYFSDDDILKSVLETYDLDFAERVQNTLNFHMYADLIKEIRIHKTYVNLRDAVSNKFESLSFKAHEKEMDFDFLSKKFENLIEMRIKMNQFLGRKDKTLFYCNFTSKMKDFKQMCLENNLFDELKFLSFLNKFLQTKCSISNANHNKDTNQQFYESSSNTAKSSFKNQRNNLQTQSKSFFKNFNLFAKENQEFPCFNGKSCDFFVENIPEKYLAEFDEEFVTLLIPMTNYFYCHIKLKNLRVNHDIKKHISDFEPFSKQENNSKTYLITQQDEITTHIFMKANFIYELISSHFEIKSPDKSAHALFHQQEHDKSFQIFLETFKFNECYGIYKITQSDIHLNMIATFLKSKNLHLTCAYMLLDSGKNEDSFLSFIDSNFYILARYFHPKIFEKNKENIKRTIMEKLNTLENNKNILVERYNGIIEKLEKIKDCDILSQSSFSSRQSNKSTKSRLRDKPGSRYEKEFLKDQLFRLTMDLNIVDINFHVLCDFKDFEDSEMLVEKLKNTKNIFDKTINKIFNYEDRFYDPARPIIMKPFFVF